MTDNKAVDIERLQKAIDVAEYTRTSTYVSKEEAVEILKSELGEGFYAIS